MMMTTTFWLVLYMLTCCPVVHLDVVMDNCVATSCGTLLRSASESGPSIGSFGFRSACRYSLGTTQLPTAVNADQLKDFQKELCEKVKGRKDDDNFTEIHSKEAHNTPRPQKDDCDLNEGINDETSQTLHPRLIQALVAGGQNDDADSIRSSSESNHISIYSLNTSVGEEKLLAWVSILQAIDTVNQYINIVLEESESDRAKSIEVALSR